MINCWKFIYIEHKQKKHKSNGPMGQTLFIIIKRFKLPDKKNSLIFFDCMADLGIFLRSFSPPPKKNVCIPIHYLVQINNPILNKFFW